MGLKSTLRRGVRILDKIRVQQFNKNGHIIFIAILLIAAITVLIVGTFKIPPDKIILPFYVDRQKYPMYQPDVIEDFPTVANGQPKIPHIIHQTWNSQCVYEENIPYIQSFVNKNPDWEYYFWTDKSARNLVKERHIYLLSYWDNVRRGVQRGDILRYVVLYEFGGVYADVDVENLRPLDRVTTKYSCIIPTEPLEHNVIRYRIPYLINNGIILCSPKHPFMKMLLDKLLDHSEDTNVLSATGPLFVTRQYNIYNRVADGTFDHMTSDDKMELTDHMIGTGAFRDDDDSAVYVPNTHFFTDRIDSGIGGLFNFKCKWFFLLSNFTKRACVELEHKGLHRQPTFTYTVHHWHHSWALDYKRLYGLSYYVKKCTEISKIVPKVKIYQYRVTN
ncbi:hypothetical protein ACF0H5_017774 [Mactra antiquata]